MPQIFDIGPPSPSDEYIDYLQSMQGSYDFEGILVWENMEGIGFYDFARYINFYNDFYNEFHSSNPTVKIFGPNIDIDLVSGSLNPDHEEILVGFMDQANGFDGLAIRAELSAEDWEVVIPYIKENLWDGPLAVTLLGSPSDPNIIHSLLSTNDIAFWPASTQNAFTFPSSGKRWTFEGSITLNREVPNLSVRVDILGNPLKGSDRSIAIYDGPGDPIAGGELPNAGGVINLGYMGVDNETHSYTYRISGLPASPGAGALKITFFADNIISKSVQGSITVVG